MATKNLTQPIGLAELIDEVKRELYQPEDRMEGGGPVFFVDEVQLEVAVSIQREGEAGINIQVLNLGGGLSKENAQSIRVTLKPLRSREEILQQYLDRHPGEAAQLDTRSMDLLMKDDRVVLADGEGQTLSFQKEESSDDTLKGRQE